jgi:nucleotide-binding universal stress UspA family protein
MAFKTLLVPLDGGDLNKAVLEAALMAARRFEAHIEVLYVRRDASASVPYATLRISASMRKTIVEAAERGIAEQAARVHAAFKAFCRKNGLAVITKPSAARKASANWREERGDAADALIRRGRLSDLIFVVRPKEGAPAPETLETALLETGRPLVIVPPKGTKCIASRITVGWNASAEAARAVADAMSCLAAAESVTVLASQKRAKSAKELVAYLAWHAIKASVEIFDTGTRSVGETLLAESRALRSDLLVIGGYTRTRASELLFGGVTRHVLNAADIPVMMAH